MTVIFATVCLAASEVVSAVGSAVVLLDPVPDDGDVKPGIGATVLFLGLVAGTILLWLSMRKQLGRIDFEEEPDPRQGPAPVGDGDGDGDGDGGDEPADPDVEGSTAGDGGSRA